MSVKETLVKIRKLGQGGYAETWLAEVRDPELIREWKSNQVAIKIPYKEYERPFKKEIQLAGALLMQMSERETRHIVRYLGFEILDQTNVMVMEYISGGSLRDRIGLCPHGKKLPAGKAAALSLGILAGLAAMHGKNVCHRDIKPENILLENEVPKISDFGIAKMFLNQELASTVAGTPYYTSPEIIAGKGGSFPADIWSFGLTFYEMLYGQLPFGLNRAESSLTIARIVADGKDLPEFPPETPVPENIKAVIRRCLSRNPDERYKSADEVARDLKSFSREADQIVAQKIREVQPGLKNPAQRSQLLTHLQELISAYPHAAIGYYHLGEFYNTFEEKELALEAFRNGLAIDPENPLFHWGIGVVYKKKGDIPGAVQALETAIRMGLEPKLARGAKVLLSSLKTPVQKK